MEIEFIAGVAVVAADPPKSRELYVAALGLPLAPDNGGEYFHSEQIDGSKHFAVWPRRHRRALEVMETSIPIAETLSRVLAGKRQAPRSGLLASRRTRIVRPCRRYAPGVRASRRRRVGRCRRGRPCRLRAQ